MDSNPPIAMTIGTEDAVRLVLKEVDKFAAPRKLPATPRQYENLRRYKEVEVWFSPDVSGLAVFHFVTHDNIDVNMSINFQYVDREYLNRLNHEIQKSINEHRAERKGLKIIDGGKLDIKLKGDSLSQSPPGGSNGDEKEGGQKDGQEKGDKKDGDQGKDSAEKGGRSPE